MIIKLGRMTPSARKFLRRQYEQIAFLDFLGQISQIHEILERQAARNKAGSESTSKPQQGAGRRRKEVQSSNVTQDPSAPLQGHPNDSGREKSENVAAKVTRLTSSDEEHAAPGPALSLLT